MIALKRPECPNPDALDKRIYNDPVNKEALRKSTSGKCMYCESKMEPISYAHVEHIKPKSKFPELEFEWTNLGFSCQICNTNKGSKYDETLHFVNPYDEVPEVYLVFLGFYVFPKKGSERGEYTINEIDLNRPGLIDRRKDKLEEIDKFIKSAKRTSNQSLRKKAIEELKKYAETDKEYSAMIKYMFIAEGIL